MLLVCRVVLCSLSCFLVGEGVGRDGDGDGDGGVRCATVRAVR